MDTTQTTPQACAAKVVSGTVDQMGGTLDDSVVEQVGGRGGGGPSDRPRLVGASLWGR